MYRDNSNSLHRRFSPNDKMEQMNRQQELIEQKKLEIQMKLAEKKRKETEEALMKIQPTATSIAKKESLLNTRNKWSFQTKRFPGPKAVDSSSVSGTTNIFSNDGSFLEQFKKISGISEGQNKDGGSNSETKDGSLEATGIDGRKNEATGMADFIRQQGNNNSPYNSGGFTSSGSQRPFTNSSVPPPNFTQPPPRFPPPTTQLPPPNLPSFPPPTTLQPPTMMAGGRNFGPPGLDKNPGVPNFGPPGLDKNVGVSNFGPPGLNTSVGGPNFGPPNHQFPLPQLAAGFPPTSIPPPPPLPPAFFPPPGVIPPPAPLNPLSIPAPSPLIPHSIPAPSPLTPQSIPAPSPLQPSSIPPPQPMMPHSIPPPPHGFPLPPPPQLNESKIPMSANSATTADDSLLPAAAIPVPAEQKDVDLNPKQQRSQLMPRSLRSNDGGRSPDQQISRSPDSRRDQLLSRSPDSNHDRLISRSPDSSSNQFISRSPDSSHNQLISRSPDSTQDRQNSRSPDSSRDHLNSRSPDSSRNQLMSRSFRSRSNSSSSSSDDDRRIRKRRKVSRASRRPGSRRQQSSGDSSQGESEEERSRSRKRSRNRKKSESRSRSGSKSSGRYKEDSDRDESMSGDGKWFKQEEDEEQREKIDENGRKQFKEEPNFDYDGFKTEPKLDVKTEPKLEVKTEPKLEFKTEPKPEVKEEFTDWDGVPMPVEKQEEPTMKIQYPPFLFSDETKDAPSSAPPLPPPPPEADEESERRRARKRRSRWGEQAPLEGAATPSEGAQTPLVGAQTPLVGAMTSQLPPVGMVIPTGLGNVPTPSVPTINVPGMKGAMISQVSRTDPALLQYAMQNFGTTQLSEEDWKKAEDHFKINLLYQDMMRKREELQRLQAAGKHKYEYDSDEEVEGGTWEHRLREKEMEATQLWAEGLTQAAAGKHHIGDFLPPEELGKFMEKYEALKQGRPPDLSDYKEYKLKEDNIGFQMLQKLGWTEGQGLGSEGTGMLDPVNKATSRSENQGLGLERPDDVTVDDDEYDAYRKRMMLAYRFRPNPLNNPRRPYY